MTRNGNATKSCCALSLDRVVISTPTPTPLTPSKKTIKSYLGPYIYTHMHTYEHTPSMDPGRHRAWGPGLEAAVLQICV